MALQADMYSGLWKQPVVPAEFVVKTVLVTLMVEELLPMAPPCLAELPMKEESSTEMSLFPIAEMAPPMD